MLSYLSETLDFKEIFNSFTQIKNTYMYIV